MHTKKCPYCGGSGRVVADSEYDGKTPEECAEIITKKIFKGKLGVKK